jgi:hypothetical protein
VLIAVALAFPSVWRLRTSVAGNSGDSLLNLWIMRSVETGLPHGWHAFWNAGIFAPSRSTLAYSETLLPVALLHWPLREIFGDVLAFNVIYLGSWVLASWCVYRLARRQVRNWVAAFVAALAFTYSPIRLVHHGHFQLVVGGALTAFAFLMLVRLLEAPSLGRGAALGAAFATVTLSASYYGLMTAVVFVIFGLGWFVMQRRLPGRRELEAIGLSFVLMAVLVAPIALKYVRMERTRAFRRSFEPAYGAHPSDFLAAGQTSYLLRHVPLIGSHSGAGRGIENRLFPGFLILGLGVLGIAVLVRRMRRRVPVDAPARELLLFAVAGIVMLVLSFGDWFLIGHHRIPLPFALLRDHVPGFAGIRAESRLVLGGLFALAMFAAIGLDVLLARVRRYQALVACGAVVLVLFECAAGLEFVRVPTTSDDGGVARALQQVAPGTVLELPMQSPRSPYWAYVEAPRQLAAVHAGDPLVNGYSGFWPAGFVTEARTLNGFPDAGAINLARQLGVRYVVLRTRLVGAVTPNRVTSALEQDRIGVYRDETARRMIDRLPAGTVDNVEALPGGYLLTLHPVA